MGWLRPGAGTATAVLLALSLGAQTATEAPPATGTRHVEAGGGQVRRSGVGIDVGEEMDHERDRPIVPRRCRDLRDLGRDLVRRKVRPRPVHAGELRKRDRAPGRNIDEERLSRQRRHHVSARGLEGASIQPARGLVKPHDPSAGLIRRGGRRDPRATAVDDPRAQRHRAVGRPGPGRGPSEGGASHRDGNALPRDVPAHGVHGAPLTCTPCPVAASRCSCCPSLRCRTRCARAPDRRRSGRGRG